MALQKEELWKQYTAKNPHWITSGANLTPDGLKKLFDQAFDRGHSLGVANGKAMAESGKQKPGGPCDTMSFLNSILRK